MKRRNLFLSLISSVIVAVAIVTVTICSVIPKKKTQQGGNQVITTPIVDVNDNKKYEDMNLKERDGSAAKPYVLYSAESFVDMLENFGGRENVYFEVVKDIDFAGGIVGYSFGGNSSNITAISNCYSSAKLIAGRVPQERENGIIGICWAGYYTVTNCYSIGYKPYHADNSNVASKVSGAYTNVYTNTILGVWERIGAMTLGVTIVPCETAADDPAEQEKETDLKR